MKINRISLLLLLFLGASCKEADELALSVVPADTSKSPCDIAIPTDSVFIENVAVLAVRFMNQDARYTDSVVIPSVFSRKVAMDLAAIATLSIPESDTVFHRYEVEAVMPFLHAIYLDVDSGANWVANLVNGIHPTGYPIFDSVFFNYSFRVGYVYYLSSFKSYQVILYTPLRYNIRPLVAVLESLPDINWASGGDDCNCHPLTNSSSDIEYVFDGDSTVVRFSVGYGDCPAGCIYRRYWEFHTYLDCTARFFKSWGDPPPY